MFFKRNRVKAAKADKKPDEKADKPSSSNPAPGRKDVVRFGIGAKLQLAFGAAAVMTVIAAAIAIYSFSATESGFQHVASNQVPAMTDALRLSAISGEISTAAARLVNASTVKEQKAISDVIAARNQEFSKVMARLQESHGSDSAFNTVKSTAQKLDANLAALKQAISERTETRAKLEQELAQFRKLHHRIGNMLTPIVDDSYFDVVAAADGVAKNGDRVIRSIVDGDLPILRTLIEIESETNLQTGLLTASALTSSPPILSMLDDRFTSSAQRSQRLLDKLPNKGKFVALKKQVSGLAKIADFNAAVGGADQGNPENLKKIFRVQESLADILVTMVDDLNFKVVTHGEAAAKHTSKVVEALVNRQISGLRNTLETEAQTQLLANIVSEGTLTKSAADIVPIHDRFMSSMSLLVSSVASLKNKKISKLVGQFVTFGIKPDNVFDQHANELKAEKVAEQAVKQNAALQSALNKAVGEVVSASEANMNQSVTGLMDQLHRNRTALLIDAIVSLLIAAGIAVFYVRRSVVRRLSAIGESMQHLSSGQLDLSVPAVDDRDEIGRMARSVVVFRDAAAAKERLEREAEDQRRQSDEERQQAAERVENERRKAAELEAKAAEEERQARERVEAERQKAADTQAQAAATQAAVIERLARGLNALSNGDFTVRLDDGFDGAMAQIRDDFNTMVERMTETLGKVKTAAREVTEAAAEISTSTTDLSQSTEEQAASLEETTSTMEEISNAVKKNAENAQQADQFAAQARDVAGRGGEVVGQAVGAMARIEESAGKIADIIVVIDEIARQTNLLALNAAVEAARAGDAGRGFAVVASEVRSLAQRSSQAAKDIKDLITSSHGEVKDGVDLVSRTGESLTEIVDSIKKVADIVSDIAVASGEQATGLEQINKSLVQMDELTQRNSALAEENAATAKTLQHQSAAMDEQVSVFHLGEDDAPAHVGAAAPSLADMPPAHQLAS
ncbi:MAG: methyl-accepting chemotaxis protein [Pseudolabrys sp.]